MSLVVKPQRLHYTVTDIGTEVIDLVTDIVSRSGIELATIDWGSATDKEQIGTFLEPLSGSRSVEPFFLLDSLGNRSGIDGLHGCPQPVGIDDVVCDVKNRLQVMDDITSKKQIRQIIDRFDEKKAVTFEENQLTLTKKGQKHAYLLDQLAKVVDRQVERNDSEERHASRTDRNDDRHSIDNLDEITRRMRRKRIATAWSLETTDPQLVDESHFYQQLRRIDILDTPNNEWNSFRYLTVVNVGTDPTNAVIHKESGEHKIQFEDMNPVAFLGGRNGQRLQIKSLVAQQPAFEQKLKILFPEPLPPGESLEIYYRISWPNELTYYTSDSSEELTQSISLTRCKQGVGELQFGIMDTIDHVGITCQKLVGGKDQSWKCISATPEHFKANHRSDLEPIHGEEYDGYMYTIGSPDSPAYRIDYTPV